jgi:hypothetical protein
VFRVSRPDRVTAVAFARDGDILLVGGIDGSIATIDVASGTVVSASLMAEPTRIIALGSRADDVTVAVGWDSIELFGLSDGRRGSPIDIPIAAAARVRPDGTVVVVPRADTDTLQIIDLNRGPLVERGWDVDPDALVGFGAGRAAAVDTSGSVEVIELSSGLRSDLELATPDGEPFGALAVTPETDGYLAWNDGTLVARWRDGEVVEQRELYTGGLLVSQTRGFFTGNPGFGRFSAGETGGGFAGAGAIAVYEYDTAKELYAFDPTPGHLAIGWAIESPPFFTTAVAPAPQDGL